MYALKPKLANYNADNNVNIYYIKEMLNVYLEISPYIDQLNYSQENTMYNVNAILEILLRVRQIESSLDNKILNYIYNKNRNCVNKMIKFIKLIGKGINHEGNLGNFCGIYYSLVNKLSTF